MENKIKLKKDGTPAKKPGRKANSNKPLSPGKGKGRKGPRPHVWVVGPDEFKHSMYTPWQMSSCQARFRGEEWDLTFDEYYNLWKKDWHNRGRKPDNVCMTRKDPSGAWTMGNVEIITRLEHISSQGRTRVGAKYKPRDTKPTQYVKRRIK